MEFCDAASWKRTSTSQSSTPAALSHLRLVGGLAWHTSVPAQVAFENDVNVNVCL